MIINTHVFFWWNIEIFMYHTCFSLYFMILLLDPIYFYIVLQRIIFARLILFNYQYMTHWISQMFAFFVWFSCKLFLKPDIPLPVAASTIVKTTKVVWATMLYWSVLVLVQLATEALEELIAVKSIWCSNVIPDLCAHLANQLFQIHAIIKGPPHGEPARTKRFILIVYLLLSRILFF